MIRMMKRLSYLLTIILLLGSCKKTIEKIQEDLLVKAMVDGQWKVTSFVRNGSNITADFATYRFKYYSNKTVDAINNGTVEKTGNWDGSASTWTTYANFTNPSYPLNLINGTWTVTATTWTSVEAYQAGADSRNMRLDKE